MRTLSLAATLSLLAAPALAAPPEEKRTCGRPDVHHARRGAPVRPRNLGELPPGNLELAVYRQLEGCEVPAIVRQNIGAVSGPARPRR